jgi:hypothetical protein
LKIENKEQKASWWIVLAFIIVPLITSIVSAVHVVRSFELSNYYFLSVVLAVAFELGALSSLAGLVVMHRINKNTIWVIFILLTLFQMVGNTYCAYDTTTTKMIANSNLVKNFSELFGFTIEEPGDLIFVKRIIAIITGAILPIISLCFLHLLITYIIKTNTETTNTVAQTLLTINNELDTQHVLVPLHENNNIKKNDEAPPIASEIIKDEGTLEQFVDKKRKKLQEDRISFTELLYIFFNNGTAKKNDELPNYIEFVEKIDLNKYSTEVIKRFLTACNYLKIVNISQEQKTALYSYDDAKVILEKYYSLE